MNEHIEEILKEAAERVYVLGNKHNQVWLRSTLQDFAHKRDEELREKIGNLELECSHTYASENADVYRAHDVGQERMKNRILSLLSQPTITSNTDGK